MQGFFGPKNLPMPVLPNAGVPGAPAGMPTRPPMIPPGITQVGNQNPWLPSNMWNNVKGGVQGALADPNAFMDRLLSNKAFGVGVGMLSNPQNPLQGIYGGMQAAQKAQDAQKQAQRQQLMQGVFKDVLEAMKARGELPNIGIQDIIEANL